MSPPSASLAGAASLGLIGAGWQAESQLAAIRTAVPSLERVVVSSRTAERAQAFAERGAEVAGSPTDAGGCDVVITAATSRDPVLRGDWLRDGALVCAIGANDPAARELDAQVISRATLVCCDSLEDARLESATSSSRWPPASSTGSRSTRAPPDRHRRASGRQSDDDIVVFKSNGIALLGHRDRARVVRQARERGVGMEL